MKREQQIALTMKRLVSKWGYINGRGEGAACGFFCHNFVRICITFLLTDVFLQQSKSRILPVFQRECVFVFDTSLITLVINLRILL